MRETLLSGLVIGFILMLLIPASSYAEDLDALTGKTVVFKTMSPDLREYGYQLVHTEPKGLGSEPLPYQDYAGKKGILKGVVPGKYGGEFWEIELETGGSVFGSIVGDAIARIGKDPRETLPGLYLLDDFNQAQEHVGKLIWINLHQMEQQLLTEDKEVSYSLKHLEPLKVVEVSPMALGHARLSRPFLLEVSKDNGETGFISYQNFEWANTFETEDPVDRAWTPEILVAISRREVVLGMSLEQATAAWGLPDKTRRTVSKEGTSEQWQYGERNLFFENGELTVYQE